MGKLAQSYTAFVASFPSILVGLLNVWPSYTLSLYTAQNTTILSKPMTDVEKSLVGSLPSLGSMFGTAIVGVVIDRVGRKKGGLILFLPIVLVWAAIEMSSSVIVILIARFFAGIPMGASLVYPAVYISEVAEDSIRGTLASGPVTLYCLGVLCSYLLGWFLSYHTIIWVNLAASLLCIFLITTVVESPVFLLRNDREEEARTALAYYKGMTPSSKYVLEELTKLKRQFKPTNELDPIINDTEKDEKEMLSTDEKDTPEVKEKIPHWKLLFVTPSSRRAFLIVGAALSLQIFMGMVPIQVYASILFSKVAPNLSSHLCSVLLAIVLLSGTLVTTFVADKAGRRILIISSSTLVALSMCCLGFLLQTSVAPAWVSAFILMLYCFSFYFGAGIVPYILLAEVFIPEVQSFALMLLIEWVWFLNFVVVGIFPFLESFLGIHGVFYIFATMGATNAVISFLLLPETKGLSTLQIQEAFLRRRPK